MGAPWLGPNIGKGHKLSNEATLRDKHEKSKNIVHRCRVNKKKYFKRELNGIGHSLLEEVVFSNDEKNV